MVCLVFLFQQLLRSLRAMDVPVHLTIERLSEKDGAATQAAQGQARVNRPQPKSSASAGHKLNKTGQRRGLGVPRRLPKNVLGSLRQCRCVRQNSIAQKLRDSTHSFARNLCSRSETSLFFFLKFFFVAGLGQFFREICGLLHTIRSIGWNPRVSWTNWESWQVYIMCIEQCK